jgi:hypothetical protein
MCDVEGARCWLRGHRGPSSVRRRAEGCRQAPSPQLSGARPTRRTLQLIARADAVVLTCRADPPCTCACGCAHTCRGRAVRSSSLAHAASLLPSSSMRCARPQRPRPSTRPFPRLTPCPHSPLLPCTLVVYCVYTAGGHCFRALFSLTACTLPRGTQVHARVFRG